MEQPVQASVVIPTKDRPDDLRRAIASALSQSVPIELLIMDDGSGAATADMVRRDFPAVRLVQSGQSLGPSVQRNRGAALAVAPILFPIDDDSCFSTPEVVAQTLAEFDDPRVGAVAIPVIHVHRGADVTQRAPATTNRFATYAFIGAAHAVRRDLYLKLGGYREELWYYGEESDFCIRMLQAGYVVRLGRADPIHHYESLRRDWARMEFYGKRNLVLFAWHNVPWPYFPVHLGTSLAKGAWHSLRCGRPWHSLTGLVHGLGMCVWSPASRRPVSGCVYRLFRRLKKRGAVPFDELEPELPPLTPAREPAGAAGLKP
ncbi:hypothetical protein AYO44_05295 [Planctomycetaceae bacterium SCGC AG-212-F19]|nr:hypothetical protein AYO44_05295 [Planctomycetaceae bacterium SCGC AG-212-F19]